MEEKLIEDKVKIEKKKDSYREDELPQEIIPRLQTVELNGKEAVKSDLNKLYKRVGDINKLHTKYLIEKDDNLNSKEFNQIYFKLKKKK